MESRYDPDDVRAARVFWYAHRLGAPARRR